MSSNFRIFYLYVVSLITLVMLIGGIVATVNNIASYFFPDSYVFFETEDSEKYDYDYDYDYGDYDSRENKEIRKQNYKNEKIKNAIVSLVVIALGGIMYKYHWSIIENERIK